jgi:hypothetical protein
VNPRQFRQLDVSGCTPGQKEKILEYATDVRKFEIERFWHRSLFFWGFITAAMVAYGSTADHPRFQTLAGCYGFLCALAWALQNRGSRYWTQSWQQKVEQVELELLGTNLFANKEPVIGTGWLASRRFSSSRLVMALSDITCFLWMAMVCFALQLDPGASFDLVKLGTVLSTAAAAGFLFVAARSVS